MASRQDVFVSYSHEDRAAVAQLVRALQVRGLSVRWDNDLQAGRNLDDQLTGLLTDAALVVVVWSEASAKSSFVLREAAAAEADGKLFPVSIDGSIPGAFRKLQTLMLTEWRGEADDPVIEGLASSLRDRLSGVEEDGPGSAPLQRGGPQPRYLDRVFSIDTLGSQGIRGAAVLISGETMVTSSASVQGLPFVSVHSLVSGSSGQAEVIPGDAADSIRAVAVLKPIGNLPATSDPLVLAVGPAARGQTVEVVALQPSGEPRVVRGSVVASDPKELRVELDPLPPDDVTAGAPIIAEGQVIGLAFERSGAQLLGVPSDVIRTAMQDRQADVLVMLRVSPSISIAK